MYGVSWNVKTVARWNYCKILYSRKKHFSSKTNIPNLPWGWFGRIKKDFWGRIGNSFSSAFLPKFSPILVNILVNWIFYWIFAQFFTNFAENFGELKKLVSSWVTKMSPILVTIIPANFKFFFLSPILVKILVNWRSWWFLEWQKCHQFWWQ